ncbi:MAG: hypothetical protein HN768_11970, partial [Rhodospirillaceae bacterium]|nr:hypothetical protein [Rhodospirillaceae bacterium]
MLGIDPRSGRDNVVNREGGSSVVVVGLIVLAVVMIGAGVVLKSDGEDQVSSWLPDLELSSWFNDQVDALEDRVEQASETGSSRNEISSRFDEAAEDQRWNEALVQADLYVESWPDDHYGYSLRGYANWVLGNCDEAVRDFSGAIARMDDYHYGHWARAHCHALLDQWLLAETDAKRAQETAFDDYDRYMARLLGGWIAFSGGDHNAAAELFSQALTYHDADTYPLAEKWLALTLAGEEKIELLSSASRAEFREDWLGGPTLDLFAGEMTSNDYLNEFRGYPAADLFAAHELFLDGDTTGALRLLERAARSGNTGVIEV